MLTLLDLPPPIRARIFERALQASLEPAQSIQELHEGDAARKIQRINRHGHDPAEIAIERCIRYPFSVHLPFEGLLRSSAWVRHEIKDVMKVFKTRRIAYNLDLVVENEVTILPAWLKCPVRSMEISRLDIDVRLLGSAEDAAALMTLAGLQQHARDRCRTLAFAIVALIARFIERGPRFEHLRQAGEIKVQTIMINFHSRKDNFMPDQKRMGRKSSVEEELGLMDHLKLSELHAKAEHGSTSSEGSNWSDSDGHSQHDAEEVVEAKDLLRTVDLVLRPLCRQEKYTLERRLKHFSNAHLGTLRRNVRKIYLSLDGSPEKAMMVES